MECWFGIKIEEKKSILHDQSILIYIFSSKLQDESSVQALIDACIQDDDKLYLCVSSPTIKDKPVQIRPWRLSDADFVLDASLPLDPRKTVFVGGVPRPLKAGKKRLIKKLSKIDWNWVKLSKTMQFFDLKMAPFVKAKIVYKLHIII